MRTMGATGCPEREQQMRDRRTGTHRRGTWRTVVALAALAGSGAVAVPAAEALGRAGALAPTFHGGTPLMLDAARATPQSTYLQSVVGDAAGRILVSGGTTDANGK